MEDNAIVDVILKYLKEKGVRSGISAKLTILKPNGIDVDKFQFNRVMTILLNNDLVTNPSDYPAGDRCLVITAKGISIIEKHGSYSAYLNKQDSKQTKTEWFANIKMLATILAMLSVVVNFGLGIWKFEQDNEINRLEINNGHLQSTVDSLQKEIETLQLLQPIVPSDSSRVTEH